MAGKTEDWSMPSVVSIVLFLILFTEPFHVDRAHARAGYAKWIKHGDIYKVDRNFGSVRHTFKVEVIWKGNGFVIDTPIGTNVSNAVGRELNSTFISRRLGHR